MLKKNIKFFAVDLHRIWNYGEN